jgi:hypothetical protein
MFLPLSLRSESENYSGQRVVQICKGVAALPDFFATLASPFEIRNLAWRPSNVPRIRGFPRLSHRRNCRRSIRRTSKSLSGCAATRVASLRGWACWFCLRSFSRCTTFPSLTPFPSLSSSTSGRARTSMPRPHSTTTGQGRLPCFVTMRQSGNFSASNPTTAPMPTKLRCAQHMKPLRRWISRWTSSMQPSTA